MLGEFVSKTEANINKIKNKNKKDRRKPRKNVVQKGPDGEKTKKDNGIWRRWQKENKEKITEQEKEKDFKERALGGTT